MTKLPKCACAAREDALKHNQLMHFIISLNDIYQPIKSSLLFRETLPDVKDDFAIVSREESHRGIASTSSGSVSKTQVSGFVSKTNFSNSGNNDISYLNLTVGHPNGTLAKIKYVGNLQLSEHVILYDVLVVLEYRVSLLSVHKLIRDNKMFDGFDEHKCYIHDLNQNKIMGTGSESGGLYLLGHLADQVFGVLQKELHVSK
ncbi:hypothetical protein Tco_0712644 [Tanacetum coccineum]